MFKNFDCPISSIASLDISVYHSHFYFCCPVSPQICSLKIFEDDGNEYFTKLHSQVINNEMPFFINILKIQPGTASSMVH